MVGLAADTDPAASRLQLLDQYQQFVPGFLRKDRAGDVDDVGLKQFHQGEVFQHKLSAATESAGDPRAKTYVGWQKVDPDGFGAKTQSSGKHHFSAPTAQVIEFLVLLEASQSANLQARKVRSLPEAEVRKRAV